MMNDEVEVDVDEDKSLRITKGSEEERLVEEREECLPEEIGDAEEDQPKEEEEGKEEGELKEEENVEVVEVLPSSQ
jgi:hypothetical protein